MLQKITAFFNRFIPRKKTLCTVTFTYHIRHKLNTKYSVTNSKQTHIAYVYVDATKEECGKQLFVPDSFDMVYTIAKIDIEPIKTVTHG